eukprot:TRINITY_DN76363_c0_g1_i1.p1 TRINITY_DN76363_c0_g1~~TRINITY_DN76363_c0_g1_i1.p1  ORF type:complete len:985 (+),score=139.68 TRINITY_DN76363_c0_g1_i1:226-3180(+)
MSTRSSVGKCSTSRASSYSARVRPSTASAPRATTSPVSRATLSKTTKVERPAAEPAQASQRLSSRVSVSRARASSSHAHATSTRNRRKLLTLTLDGTDEKAGFRPSFPPGPVIVKAVVPSSWADVNGIVLFAAFLSINEMNPEKMTKRDFIALLQERPITMTFALPLFVADCADLGMKYEALGGKLVVESVAFGGWSCQRGVEPGDRILAIAGEPVDSLTSAEFANLLEVRPVLLTVAPANSIASARRERLTGGNTESTPSQPSSKNESSSKSQAWGVVKATTATRDRFKRHLRKSHVPQDVDIFGNLPLVIREEVLAFACRKSLFAVQLVSQTWTDAVYCFMLPNDAERTVWRALRDLLCLPFKWINAHRNAVQAEVPEMPRPWHLAQLQFFQKSPVRYMRDIVEKGMGLFDAACPEGEMTRGSFGKAYDTLWFASWRHFTKVLIIAAEEYQMRYGRKFCVYGLLMRKCDALSAPKLVRELDEAFMEKWNKTRCCLFDLLDRHAGGSGVITRSDVERSLHAVEAIFIDASREKMTAALNEVCVYVRAVVQSGLSTIQDFVAWQSTRVGMFLSSFIRHIYNLFYDTEVLFALLQSATAIGNTGWRPHPLLKLLLDMFQAEAVTRAKWKEMAKLVERTPVVQSLCKFLSLQSSDPGMLGEAYVRFLRATSGGINEADFVDRFRPAAKEALDGLEKEIIDVSERLAPGIQRTDFDQLLLMFHVENTRPFSREAAQDALTEITTEMRQIVRQELDAVVPDILGHIFRILDSDNDGIIDSDEFTAGRQVLGAQSVEMAIVNMFDLVDSNKDGVLNPLELIEFYHKVTDMFITFVQIIFETFGVVMGYVLAALLRIASDAVRESLERTKVRTSDVGVFAAAACVRVGTELLNNPFILGLSCRLLSGVTDSVVEGIMEGHQLAKERNIGVNEETCPRTPSSSGARPKAIGQMAGPSGRPKARLSPRRISAMRSSEFLCSDDDIVAPDVTE